MHDIGGVFVGMLLLALVVGVWAWILLLFKRGPKALLGYDQVVVHEFEKALLYKGGTFNRILLPGVHSVRLKNGMLVKGDMRPEVFQIAQGTVTSDHFPVLLRCIARIQIRDARTAIESTQNYRHEVHARLQSTVKMVGGQRSFKDLHPNHDQFNVAARQRATQEITEIGCECVGFELLHTESAGAIANLEDKRIGFGPR